jgi:hypothetical protein
MALGARAIARGAEGELQVGDRPSLTVKLFFGRSTPKIGNPQAALRKTHYPQENTR